MSDQNTDPNTEENKDQSAAPESSQEEQAENTTPEVAEEKTDEKAPEAQEETPETPQEEQSESQEVPEEVTEETSEEAAEANNEEESGEEMPEGTGLLSHEKKTALKTSVGKQAKNTGRNWYVIHTYSGYEDAVEKALRQRIESLNMHDLIFDIIVPKESTITIKKGEHVTEKKRLFPGYVLVEMIVTDESWYVVRNTPNVTGFVGSGTIPVPVHPEEFNVIQKHIKKEEPKFKINFQVGEQVIISDGPFKTYEGLIDTIDEKKGKLKVLVTIFGRETPVELDFVQVKKK